MAYAYSASLTVAASQVTGALTDYPALVSNTFDGTGGMPDLRIVGSGGKIQNEDTSGTPASKPADFGFYSDSGLTTLLKFEIETWDKTTGVLVAWVKVPSIATSTVIYMGYGDAGITTALDDAANVWVAAYKFVAHLSDNAASTTVRDSTSNGNTGTNQANTSTKTATGKISKGLAYNGSTDWTTIPGNSGLRPTAAVCISCWVNPTGAQASYAMLGGVEYAAVRAAPYSAYGFNCNQAGSGKYGFDIADGTTRYTCDSTTSITNGTPVLLHGVFDGTNAILFVNGVQENYVFAPVSIGYSGGSPADLKIAAIADASAQWFVATYIDEFRVRNATLTGDWCLAEYKNQSAPTTFWTQGSETSTGGGGGSTWGPSLASGWCRIVQQ